MPLRRGSPLPPLEGATETFNADGFDAADLAGNLVFVHFWGVSCHTCHEVMDQVTAIRDENPDLKFIGVHMPQKEDDMDLAAVKKDIAEYGLTHPIFVDNAHTITQNFENQFVPAFYLFDKEGKLFFRASGDKFMDKLREKVAELKSA